MNLRLLTIYLVGTLIGWLAADWFMGGMHRVDEMWAARLVGMLGAGVLIWSVQRFRSIGT